MRQVIAQYDLVFQRDLCTPRSTITERRKPGLGTYSSKAMGIVLSKHNE